MADGNNHIDLNSKRIEQPLTDGYYACSELETGEVIIRNLKEESKQWNENRTVFWNDTFHSYPFSSGYNFQYIEMYHWLESSPYRCDYEKGECNIKSGDVVIDIGANIGMFSRYALDRGASKVIAFEPASASLKCLLLNVDLHKVDLHKSCLYSHTGFLDIRVTKESYPMASTTDQRTIEHVENVPCYTIDDLIKCNILPSKIDFMKVDVEGSECHVFNGLSDSNLANIDRLAVETHHHPVGSPYYDDENIQELLGRLVDSFDEHIAMSYGADQQSYTATINCWRN